MSVAVALKERSNTRGRKHRRESATFVEKPTGMLMLNLILATFSIPKGIQKGYQKEQRPNNNKTVS